MKTLKKLLLITIIAILIALTFGTINSVNAESAGPIYLGIVALRSSGHGYVQSEKKVWKIAEYENATDISAKPDLSKTIYCIKAGVGFGSSNVETGGTPTISTYTQKFDLRSVSTIETPYDTPLPTGENYNKLMWILDNLYIMPDPEVDNSTNRNEFLSKVIPDKQYELLTDDDIDAIQQLAIWYYTNPTGIYHNDNIQLYTNTTAGTDSDYKTFEDLYGDDGWDRQDAAKALYKYFINTAPANYTSTSTVSAPTQLVNTNAKMRKIGDNYVAGPYTINELLDVNYTISATYTDMEDNSITPSLAIKNESNEIVATDKTLKELVGTEFYLTMPVSLNITGIKMNIVSSYKTRTISYWSVENAPETEQPVVIIDETPHNFSIETSIVVPKPFDLALRKFITGVNDDEITDREPDVDVTELKAGRSQTATYNHPKTPVKVAIGDVVEYTIRVYNEGDIDGYVEEITDHLPAQLEFLPEDPVNQEYGWGWVSRDDLKTVKTSYLSAENELTPNANKILAFDGNDLDYRDVKIRCKVVATEPMAQKITNIANITEFTDGEGNEVTDRDSQSGYDIDSETGNEKLPTGTDLENYKDKEINRGEEYISGKQDDDDFEKLMIKEFDLALRKFITGINEKQITDRTPDVDITSLKAGTSKTAIYNHPKTPVEVTIGSIVEYTIRVYNEAELDGYVEEITDYLPAQLKFLPDHETNKKYGWVMIDKDGRETTDSEKAVKIKTSYLSVKNEKTAGENKILAFDGTKLSYKDVKVACEVITTNPMVDKITNIADITKFTDGKGNTITDRDSEANKNLIIPEDAKLPEYTGGANGKNDPHYDGSNVIKGQNEKEYYPGQEDDDDFEKLVVKEFDLSLRKFITAVNDTQITNREPEVDITPLTDESGKTAIYNHPKDPVLVSNGNIVTYTIRVYNEGEIDGYAQVVKDDIPEGLEFLPEHDTNKEYRWVMLDKDGTETTEVDEAKSIITDYLSKDQEETDGDNLIKAFDGTKLSYKDVKVAFKVVEPNTSDRIIINKAQISEDSDKEGNDVDDRDSTPDVWNEGEDDQDIEKIKVQYFDLSLRKWVTQAIVIENGEETIKETGHKAEDDPEAIVKVDLKKSKINKVTVKFRYKIRVTNEGKIAGYVKEIKDYIPKGLKFVQEDNKLWTALDDNTIVTDQAKDILLQPGESTEVEVLLTWINDEDNMGVMDNWAEISKDYNEFNSPDIDSTPNNRKEGEDDIDDAPVMITVQTGQIRTYTTITLAVLTIISSGVVLIKKFVL